MSAAKTLIVGCKEVQFGVASAAGTMPSTLTKCGKVYKGTCAISQDAAEVTEHFEEDHSAPEERLKDKKPPVLKFSIMVEDLSELEATIGGSVSGDKWGFSGDETAPNKAVRVVTKKGGNIDIPNGDIDGVINAQLTKGGLFLVEVTVTPLAVSGDGNKSFYVDRTTNAGA